MKRITATFYRSTSAKQPVKDWLTGLSEDDRKIVGKDIATVEFGWPIGMPVCRPLAGASPLREVRSTIKSGKVEARVVFAIDAANMVLLHGFEKDSKRQPDEIRLAVERWRSYMTRREGKE